MTTRDIHVVGSVPFQDATEVFSTLGGAFGKHLPWIPDGETDFRARWSYWVDQFFGAHPDFVKTGQIHAISEKPGDPGVAKYRLRDGVKPDNVRFDNLPLAKVAIASYRDFRRLKDTGKIPASVRMQFDLAPAHIMVWRWFVEDLHEVLEPLYDRALRDEIGKMVAVIPKEELAIQWDIASRVFARLEWGKPTRYGRTKDEMVDTFARNLIELGGFVPDGVDLLYHFCYGYTGRRHTVEPTDMTDMVVMANRVMAGIARPVQLIHMPVPRGRADAAFYAPLQQLKLRPETRISLGLVHHSDGIEGTQQRSATAQKFLKDFLVSTECGWSQRPRESIPDLLRVHAAAAGLQ
jgi:hypothetical protein